jgi:hypothetical protein
VAATHAIAPAAVALPAAASALAVALASLALTLASSALASVTNVGSAPKKSSPSSANVVGELRFGGVGKAVIGIM